MLETVILKAITTITGLLGTASWEKLKRQDRIVMILQKLGFDQGRPPPDFGGVYAYSLVLYGVEKSQAVLDLFRHPEVVDGFRSAFAANDQAAFNASAARFLDWNRIGDELREAGVNVTQEGQAFFESFRQVASLSRTPAEILLSHQVAELKAMEEEARQLRAKTQEDWLLYRRDQLDQAEARYRQLALTSCDIIDLAGLPEQDRHVVLSKFVMRQLYVPLRLEIEEKKKIDGEGIESARISRQNREAGQAAIAQLQPAIKRLSLGEVLATTRRLVILGDPGGGKSTLLRWLATVYLLRLKHDKDAEAMPDVATLPQFNYLPIVIRCRDLDHGSLTGALDDMLWQTLRKAEMSPEQAEALPVILRHRLSEGTGLLLIDGLDEISDARTRIQFCKQLERMALAFPNTPIVITSRIVGYRQMGFRLGQGFVHAALAELSPDDKNLFAQRWCELTEPEERRSRVTAELIQDIHSADRIERLTGNPMLLTTMALVKRKVGKLPSRRAELYREAVHVLLNWRREVDEPLDPREALPQLEYLAYEMCRRGEQSLSEPEALELLERIRREYPNIRSIQKHTPEQFLQILEQRTSIVIQSGTVRHDGQMVPVYEFRHLTFQEYLAGLALVEGRFPGHDKSRSLAERVAPLALLAARSAKADSGENWREALRLCIASCNDDDADDVLQAILNPAADGLDSALRSDCAQLAGLCLADEPNVSEETGKRVLNALVASLPAEDRHTGFAYQQVFLGLATSEWGEYLLDLVTEEFIRRSGADRISCNQAMRTMLAAQWPVATREELEFRLNALILDIRSKDERRSIRAASFLGLSYYFEMRHREELLHQPHTVTIQHIEALVGMLEGSNAAIHIALWALAWIIYGDRVLPVREALPKLGSRLTEMLRLPKVRGYISRYLAWVLGQMGESSAVEELILLVNETIGDVPVKAFEALLEIGGQRAENFVRSCFINADDRLRSMAMKALPWSKLASDSHCRELLSEGFDGGPPFIDMRLPVDTGRVLVAAERLDISEAEIRRLYETLAEKLPLRLVWRNGETVKGVGAEES